MGMAVGSGEGGYVADINVTPMVDVMLVLLIIFMVIAPMLQNGVSVALPKSKYPDPDPNIIKDTSVVALIGVSDLMYQAIERNSFYEHSFEIFTSVAAISVHDGARQKCSVPAVAPLLLCPARTLPSGENATGPNAPTGAARVNNRS